MRDSDQTWEENSGVPLALDIFSFHIQTSPNTVNMPQFVNAKILNKLPHKLKVLSQA